MTRLPGVAAVVLTAMAATLASCTAIPPHSAPPSLRSEVPLGPSAAPAPGTWPEAPWWRRYDDATLDALMSRALAASPGLAGATIAAIRKTHAALRADVTLAAQVGRKLFPPHEAELIAALIARDLPYYDTAISESFVAGMNAFARDMGILRGDVPYGQIVVPQLRAASDASI